MLQQFLLAQTDTLPIGPPSSEVIISNGDIWSFIWPILGLLLLASVIVTIAMWKVFVKAGRPGWTALVPVYNSWCIYEVAGRPGWWSLVSIASSIPLINFIAVPAYLVLVTIAYIDLAKSFGKSTGFGVSLVFLPFIGFPILGFGSAQYGGPAGPVKGAGGQASGGFGQAPPQPPQMPLAPPDAASNFAFNQSPQSAAPQPPQQPQAQPMQQTPPQPQPAPQQGSQYGVPQAQVVQPQQSAANQSVSQPAAAQAPAEVLPQDQQNPQA